MLPEKKRILVISGEPLVLAEIKMELIEYFDVRISASGKSAFGEDETYKAVVIHIGKNHEKSFEEFGRISGSVKNIPVIFLSEYDNENDEISAFALGASDYALRRRGSRALISRINLRIAESQSAANKHDSDEEDYEKYLSGKTILIAEDVELNREIIIMLLSGIEDLNLDFAANGKEAVEKFRGNPGLYSLIFMDVHMPEMDGLEATKIIRSLDCPNAREIPIVALTGSVSEDEIAICLKAGMNDFAEKPMSYDKLVYTAIKYCL
jgi:CheY-like chemotaxis protein